MSAEISPLLVRTPAAARPLWLRLRRSSPFTLTVLMCCLALLWVSPFIWMLATSFSATTFGDDMASLLPRLPLTLDNFRDASEQRRLAEPVRQHPYLHLRHLLRAAVDHHHRRLRLRLPRVSRQADAVSPVPGAADDHAGGDDGAEHADPENLRPAQHPHRGDDALLHLGVRRVPDASGVPRHSERAGGGGADGGLPLVAGAVPRTAADVLGRRCWPSPPSALPTTGTSTCGR